MTDKNKTGRDRGDGATRKTSDGIKDSGIEPVAGWYALARPARLNRQQRRSWRREGRGVVRGDLLALLVLLAVAGLLLAGGLR